MAQAGYTPIRLYYSTTASAAPAAGNLADGELAINTNDGKLYYKDNGGAVQTIAYKNVPISTLSGAGTGVLTALGNAVNTSAGVVTQSGTLALNNLLVGGGSGSAIASVTTGTGVLTALQNNTNTAAGVVTQSGILASSSLLVGGGSGSAITSTTTGTGVLTALGTAINTTGGFITAGGSVRVVTVADATSITVDVDATDIAVQTNTQAAGTLTINAPTGTASNGERFMIRVQCTNAQTLSWNAIFQGSNDIPLPTATTGSSKYDYLGFIYNSTAVKWQLIARAFGF